MSKLAWPIAAIVALTPGLLTTPVFAQGSIEEIVVTAQRREQAIQDVPISITAFSQEDLEVRGVENVDQLDLLLPNVMIRGGGTTGPTDGNFTMRGVPGVARYLDGVAQIGMKGSLPPVVELERIEVLKGPQGTLFGKGAMGGAISYVSVAPADEFGARIRASVGNYNQRQLGANIDIPITPDFLTKISYYSNQKDGYVQSGISNVQHGDESDNVVRLDAVWNVSPNFSAKFDITQTLRDPAHPSADVLYDVNDDQFWVKKYNEAGLVFTDASDAFGMREEYRNSSNFAGPGWKYDSTSYNLTLEFDLSDTLSLRTITGHREYKSEALADLDASHWQFFEIWTASLVEEYSQEVQLASDGDRLDWVVGFYLNDYDATFRRFDWQFADHTPRITNWITESKTQDTAVFFQATYDLSDQLDLTVGGRYTEEDFEGGQWAAVEDIPKWPNTTYTFRKGAVRSSSAAGFYSFTPRVSLTYDYSDNVMAYVTYSEGFGAGGVNTTAVNGEFTPYSGETLLQYEVGLRSMLFDNSLRFNLSYFNGTWEDMQVGEALVPGRIVRTNAGEAEMSGVELDTLWAVSDNFTVNLSLGFLDTEYTELGTTQTIKLDSKFAFAPEFQGTIGGQYDYLRPNGSVWSYRLDYGWTGKYVTIQDIRLQKMQPQYGLVSGRFTYEPVNADWSYSIWGRNLTNEWYQQGGFGAFLGGVDQGVVARPREFGLTLNLDF
ncbi:MAG: TonB-dependent receptor [Pseudohongiellaceae bacterium]